MPTSPPTFLHLSKDFLWLQLRDLPYFRALMRAVEASFYATLNLPQPMLDVGCGDGHFVTVAFDQKIEVGIDSWSAPLHEAAQRKGYHSLCQGDGARMPFPEAYFASAISNSVLEHIPHVQDVLQETGRVLKPGAPFVFCGPNHRFLESLSVGRFLDTAHLKPLGDKYRSFFNRISRHYNSDAPEIWEERLSKAGFTLERWWHYYPPNALHVTEWGHYFGLPCLFWHIVTGKWILIPSRWNLSLTYRYTRRHYHPSENADGVCTFFIARRNQG
jgi:ubiquinone/menaquinone biosynthesis C-methylase UbiE